MVTQLLLCRSPARGRPLRPRQPRPGPRLGSLQRHRGRLATGPRSHILITVDIKRYIDNGACLRRPPRLWRGWGCPASTRASPAAACSPSARTRTAGTLTASSETSGEVSGKYREISLTALMCGGADCWRRSASRGTWWAAAASRATPCRQSSSTLIHSTQIMFRSIQPLLSILISKYNI